MCVRPLKAWQLDDGSVVFVERGAIRRPLSLACGQCVECRLDRSRQWAIRIMHESQVHDASCFVTLTYDDDRLPDRGSLRYRDFQLFMKRLRKKLGIPVRFYMCGEYGELTSRPHFHACLFGCHFGDRRVFKQSGSGFTLYTSELLSSLWTDGFASVAELSFESAAYVARYVMKKVTGDLSDDHYRRTDFDTGEVFWLEPEFARMSLKPGIGFKWFEKYKEDVFENDYVIVNGRKVKPPKYYDRLLTVFDAESAEFMELQRYQRLMSTDFDNSEDRLRAREIVTRARMASKLRGL